MRLYILFDNRVETNVLSFIPVRFEPVAIGLEALSANRRFRHLADLALNNDNVILYQSQRLRDELPHVYEQKLDTDDAVIAYYYN